MRVLIYLGILLLKFSVKIYFTGSYIGLRNRSRELFFIHKFAFYPLKGECSVFSKQIILWMKTIHYPNKIRSHLVTIVPMAPFTPKSTSN